MPAGRFVTTALFIVWLSAGVRAADDPWLGRDKALHAAVSTGLAAGGYAAVAALAKESSTRRRVLSGLTISLGAGAVKEWRDRGYGSPSWRDFAWDGVGAAAGTTIAWLIDRSRQRGRPGGRAARAGESQSRARATVRATALDASRACPCP